MPRKFSVADSLFRTSFARLLACASAFAAVTALSGCGGGGSSGAPELPVVAKAWSPVSVSAVSSTTPPQVFSDGIGGALVVTSSATATVVQRFDGVTGWQLAQTFPLATNLLRSASGVTLVGHDASNWWRIDVSASATTALVKSLPYGLPELNSVLVSLAPNGRLLFIDTVPSQDSSFNLRIREVEGSTLVSTSLYPETSPGVRNGFVRDLDGDWMSTWLVGYRSSSSAVAWRGVIETTFVTKLSAGMYEPMPPNLRSGTMVGWLRMEGDGRASVLEQKVFSDGSADTVKWYRMVGGILQDVWAANGAKSGRTDQVSRAVRADGTPVWTAYDSTVGSNRIWEGRDAATWTTTDATETACLPSRMSCQAFSVPSATRVASLSQNAGQSATSNELFISERTQVGRWASSAHVSLATLASVVGAANAASHELAAYVETGAAQIVVGFVRYELTPGETRYATFATSK